MELHRYNQEQCCTVNILCLGPPPLHRSAHRIEIKEVLGLVWEKTCSYSDSGSLMLSKVHRTHTRTHTHRGCPCSWRECPRDAWAVIMDITAEYRFFSLDKWDTSILRILNTSWIYICIYIYICMHILYRGIFSIPSWPTNIIFFWDHGLTWIHSPRVSFKTPRTTRIPSLTWERQKTWLSQLSQTRAAAGRKPCQKRSCNELCIALPITLPCCANTTGYVLKNTLSLWLSKSNSCTEE